MEVFEKFQRRIFQQIPTIVVSISPSLIDKVSGGIECEIVQLFNASFVGDT